ncbi:MAG TPA: Mur ligase family protein [Patescibacteria group bacterium]|nr:Mur ligase family protein [Patescibacteria group bacterium]
MKISTYSKARAYLENLIRPSYIQRIYGAPDFYHDPLRRMGYLLNLLDNPQKKFPSVVVSGTSGKGSTAYLIAHILATAGYKVGMTVSPHLGKLTDRMQLTNEKKQLTPIDDRTFIALLNEMIKAIEHMQQTQFGPPSYYEALLTLCFLCFAKEQPDIAIIEVGFEGKYDGTQVLDPNVFVYTNTSLDHIEILGDTVEEIAVEGASAIKRKEDGKHLIVISGITQKSVQDIFQRACQQAGSQLFLLGRDFSSSLEKMSGKGDVFTFVNPHMILKNVRCSLVGAYQATNASLAIETVFQLRKFGFSVSEESIRNGLQTAFFPGRFEKINNTILDGAHNRAKMYAFISSLKKLYPTQRKIFLLAFKEDRRIIPILRLILPHADAIIITEYHVALDLKKNSTEKSGTVALSIQSLFYKKPLFITTSVAGGLRKARQIATKDDLIIVTGSLYLIAECRKVLFSQ